MPSTRHLLGTRHCRPAAAAAVSVAVLAATVAISPRLGGPPNDTCADATVVSEGLTAYTMDGASADEATTCFPTCPCPDVFFRFVPEYTGWVQVSVCGDTGVNGVEVYEGCECPLLANTIVACGFCPEPGPQGTCRSVTSAPVSAGQCYSIYLAQQAGGGTISIMEIPPAEHCDPAVYDTGSVVPPADYSLDAAQPSAGWMTDGVIDDLTLTPAGGTSFDCFSAEIMMFLGDGNFETMRVRIYELPPGGIAALGDFNVEVPVFDHTVSIAAGDLNHVDTGFDSHGTWDIGRVVADLPPTDLGPGHFGVHVSFPGTGEVGAWPAASFSPSDCAAVWGLATSQPQDLCASHGDELTNVSFRFGSAIEACPWDCGEEDGVIDILDLLALLAQWGGPGACDADGSQTVGEADLGEMLDAWGSCPGGNAS